jgi:hypothetical protein
MPVRVRFRLVLELGGARRRAVRIVGSVTRRGDRQGSGSGQPWAPRWRGRPAATSILVLSATGVTVTF